MKVIKHVNKDINKFIKKIFKNLAKGKRRFFKICIEVYKSSKKFLKNKRKNYRPKELMKHSPIMSSIGNVYYLLKGKPPRYIPIGLEKKFTMNGRSKLLYKYKDDTVHIPLTYNSSIIDKTCKRIGEGELGEYGKVDQWLYQGLDQYPIKGCGVAIMGSADQGFGPWYECICIQYGAHPTTIDYNEIQFNDSRIKFVKAPVDMNTLHTFDAAFSISSFEHDGLGRYGDPINPNGDLEAMLKMKKVLKKGGLLYLSVPLGMDKVVFNDCRIYGRNRLPLLLRSWTMVHSVGFEETLLDRDTDKGWKPMTKIKQRNGDIRKELIHPGYPEYGPILILRND